MDNLKLKGLGVCTHFSRREKGWKVEDLLPLACDMGVSLVRDEIEWSRVETEKGKYQIPEVDQDWLQQVTDAGLGINLILLYGNQLYDNPLDPEAFANYAVFMARTLIGKYNIVALEIWNEPTNFEFKKYYDGSWSGQGDCLWLEKFAELVSITAEKLKKEFPEMPLIVAPGEPQFFHMAMRYPDSLKNIDGIAAHPYPGRFPAETVPWGGKQINKRDGISVADDDHSYLSLWRKTQEHCRKYLGHELALHTTEWGYSTYNHHLKGSNTAGYSESAQAIYIARGLILNMVAGVKTIYIYALMDDGTDRFEQEDNFGIVKHEKLGLAKKPAWASIRRLAEILGADCTFVKDAPPILETEINALPYNDDLWQHPVREPHLCITDPQFFNFAAGKDLVSFLWLGGRINGEYQSPVGQIVWHNAPEFKNIEICDIFTGEKLPLQTITENGNLNIKEVPVGNNPIAIRWIK